MQAAAIASVLWATCLLAVSSSAVELELDDGRRASLELEAAWTIKQETPPQFSAFVLRYDDGESRLSCTLFIVRASVMRSTEKFQRENLLEAIRGLGGELEDADLQSLDASFGTGFYGVFRAQHEKIKHPTMIATGRILFPLGDVVLFTITPFDRETEPRRAILRALRDLVIVGEPRSSPPDEPTGPMREVTVTISFRVQPDGTAAQLEILDSTDSEYNDRAVAIVRSRTYPRGAVGRRMVQPVIFREEIDGPTGEPGPGTEELNEALRRMAP